MNFADTVMSGRAGAYDLAGVAIGASLWTPIFTGINGILIALSPIVAQLIGAGRKEKIGYTVLQGIFLAVVLAVAVLIIGSFVLNPILHFMDLEPEVERIAKYYLIALSTGIIPLFVFNIIRSFIDALGQTRITMFITLLALPINVFFNYILIFGKLGMPALGGIGAGIATAITYFISMILGLIVLLKLEPFTQYKVFVKGITPSLKAWWEQLKIGIPIGFAIFFETSIFSAVTLMMSKYDTVTIAGHQAAMNFQSMLYMIPLSISMALTICIGFEVGGKRFLDAKIYSKIGISVAIILAILGGAVMYFFDDQIAHLYSNNEAVIEAIKHFLIYAIFFQLADAFGGPVQGALRGYKDVNITSIMLFISYWIIGLPLGFILAIYTGLGPYGYWIGLIAGLSAGAITLYFRLRYIQRVRTN